MKNDLEVSMHQIENNEIRHWKEVFRRWYAEHKESDGAHGLDHVERVWKICMQIGANEKSLDWLIVLAIAYFHDVVSYPKNDPRTRMSAQVSSEYASDILQGLGFPVDKIRKVRSGIAAHSYSAASVADFIEGQIVQDADRIDALGAIGIARMFYIAGQTGADLYDPADPYADRRQLDDKKFAIDHFTTKLGRLVFTLNTQAGREIAEERLQLMRAFQGQLAREIGS